MKILTTTLEAELLASNIICFRPLLNDYEFGLEDAHDMARIYDTMAGGGVFATLIDVVGTNATATPEMRAYGAGRNYKSHQVARAITSDAFFHRLLVNHFMKSLHAAVPTRVFSEKEPALKWLKEQMATYQKTLK